MAARHKGMPCVGAATQASSSTFSAVARLGFGVVGDFLSCGGGGGRGGEGGSSMMVLMAVVVVVFVVVVVER